MLEQHRAMNDALHLKIAVDGRQVIEQQDGSASAREELLEREDLSAIAKGIVRKRISKRSLPGTALRSVR